MSLLFSIREIKIPYFNLKFGIVEIDTTFVFFVIGLLIGLIAFHSLKSLFVVLLFLAFIVFILLHDFVQILIAKTFSLKLRKFIIFPFGTKKFYGKDFDNAKQEFIYAFAGLLVYFVLMLAFAILGLTVFSGVWPETITLQNTLTSQTFDFTLMDFPLFFLFWVSFLLFAFNLFIFAMPMDGGRLVKALLTIIFGQYSANKMVPYISRVITLLVILAGLFFWDIIIILIGLFIYYTTVKELREYEILRVLEGKSVKYFMKPCDLIFNSEQTVTDCFKEMKKTMIPDAVVTFDEGGFGVIDVEEISKVSKLYWPTTKIGTVAKIVDGVSERENLAFVAQYMVTKDLEIIPVVDACKTLLGIIKRAEFSDYIKIHKIL